MKHVSRSLALFVMAIPFALALSQHQHLSQSAVVIAAVGGWFLISASTLYLIRHFRG